MYGILIKLYEELKMEKNICIITTVDTTLSAFVIPSAKALKDAGFTVTLLASMSDDFINKHQTEFDLINIPMERGIKPLGIFKSIKAIYTVFKNNKYTLIQYSTPNAAFYASIAGWMARIKMRIYGQWGIRYITMKGVSRWIFKFIEYITCLLSTVIRTTSDDNMSFSIKEGLYKRDKVKMLGKGGASGADLDFFDYTKKIKYKQNILEKYPEIQGKFIFGFVARLDRDKGVNELLDAFLEFNKIYPDTKLLVIGALDKPKGLDPNLMKLAHNSANIIFTGFSKIVPQYMSAMDIFLFPTHREGFGGVILQAMAMGVPVITTNVPGAREAIENNISGLLCEAHDSQSLINAMEILYKDEKQRHKFSSNGLERVNKYFSRSQMTKLIVDDREALFQYIYNKIN